MPDSLSYNGSFGVKGTRKKKKKRCVHSNLLPSLKCAEQIRSRRQWWFSPKQCLFILVSLFSRNILQFLWGDPSRALVCGRPCPADPQRRGSGFKSLILFSGQAAAPDFSIIFTLRVVFKAYPDLNSNLPLITDSALNRDDRTSFMTANFQRYVFYSSYLCLESERRFIVFRGEVGLISDLRATPPHGWYFS